ncbi:MULTISPECIES: Rv3235 family protein [unclassified Streptomyces]|uniref:Rv3235 family protein n=1 Tax=unclassified Streptomyces TaxID=2593676 RepID=UPI00339DB3B3
MTATLTTATTDTARATDRTTAPTAVPAATATPPTAAPTTVRPDATVPAAVLPAGPTAPPATAPATAASAATPPAAVLPVPPAGVPVPPLGGATRRPRTPRPRTAPGGPAGTRPRGSAGTRPRTPERGAPRALPPHTVFAERLLAVLSGERPVHWMLGHTLGEAYEQLVRLAPETPLRSLGPRPVLRRCSVQAHPAQDAVEAFATIATGARVRAMAFRLERGADRRWRCAAVELDGLGTA